MLFPASDPGPLYRKERYVIKKLPWFKFYASRWLGDPHLPLAGLQAHGLLINMMAIAHDGDPRGFVTNGGQPVTIQELARVCHTRTRDCLRAARRLSDLSRIKQDENGTYYIPSMVRETEETQRQSEFGLKGYEARTASTLKGKRKSETASTLKAPLKVHSEEEVEKRKIKSKKRDHAFQYSKYPRFLTLWDCYPKTGSKFKALESFAQIEPDDETLEKMLDSVRQQKVWRQQQKAQGKFVAPWRHTSTWLNQRGWEDEAPESDGASVSKEDRLKELGKSGDKEFAF